jgi:NDP-sugar pyrophosphorylase family protein
MPIDDMPILEIVLLQLKKHGFTKIVLAVGHLAGLIQAYCGDGSRWGLNITYSMEHEPSWYCRTFVVIDGLEENFLVMNGDLLTNIDYSDLMKLHLEKNALATVSMYNKDVPISLGVLKLDDSGNIIDYIEKPTITYKVSMGIYILNRKILDHIEKGKYLDFPVLIKQLIEENEKVVGYDFTGYWMDIGRHEDYSKVLEEFNSIRDELL